MPDFIELRSDTFTQPSPAMRRAMCEAEVGDDVVSEDPTINELQRRVADLFGMQAALFVPSGTQSNQLAVWSHCQPGDELIIESTGHIVDWEGGGPAVLRGVSTRRIQGVGGMLDPDDMHLLPMRDSLHCPAPRLLCLENTTNMGGGRVYPLGQFSAVARWGREHGLKVHLDGARVMNACAAGGYGPRDVAAEVDSVSLCLSKGLGCPVGSVLSGSAEFIDRARRGRKVLGGAMRQGGILAAAGIYALNYNVDRLSEDHANARRLGQALDAVEGIRVNQSEIDSNMVFATLEERLGPADAFAASLQEAGVRMYPVGPRRLRMVTHLDFHADQIAPAAAAFEAVVARSHAAAA